MKFWPSILKNIWTITIIGGAAAIVLGTLLVSTTAQAWALDILRVLWAPPRAIFSPVAGWLAATIPVSRGQCVVWFLVGFGTCFALFACHAVWQRVIALTDDNLTL